MAAQQSRGKTMAPDERRKYHQNTMNETKPKRINWTTEMIEAARQLEERNKVIEVVQVHYPPSDSISIKIDGSLRSFASMKQAALHLQEGLRWI